MYVLGDMQKLVLLNDSGFVTVTVAIPTYGREGVLIDTIDQIIAQVPPPAEILVLDQTPKHESETEERLSDLSQQARIRWIRLQQPSQPKALNCALVEASQPVVIFLDDDVRVGPEFVQTHAEHYRDDRIWAVAGQVLQPGQAELRRPPRWTPSTRRFADMDFPFNSDEQVFIQNAMSGNMSVRRDRAIEIGGFDENFVPPVSYRFDAEFCKRLSRRGGKILFEPKARIYHLRCEAGGTRTAGSHLTSASPIHGVGDYYFALRQGISWETFSYMLRRPFREVSTRFHLKHPWWIPVKIVGELRALFRAVVLYVKGPRYLHPGPR
jgi:GT2 family glycosyltransferase